MKKSIIKLYTIFLMLLVIGQISCNNKEIKKSQKLNTAPKIEGQAISYPSLPMATVEKLYKECTYMDYIFDNLNFSISQDKQSSIRASIGFISTEPPENIPTGCKSIGRKFFHINGEIVLEADVYFSNNCSFYIFFENGKPKYANKMTTEGLNFYNNIIKTGQQQEKEILKGTQ